MTWDDKPVEKSVLKAYLWWFPLGLFGAHRLYLGQRSMGYIYMFSAGYLLIGWIIDGFVLRDIVREVNEAAREDKSGPSCSGPYYRGMSDERCRYWHYEKRSLRDAMILVMNPLGIIGTHHQYLGRPLYRIPYGLTAGLFLFGWLIDIFRIKSLTDQCNDELGLLQSGVSFEEMKGRDVWDCKTFDAYFFGATVGIFGGHHFYLGRYKWGFLYLFTLGGLFVGVIYDLVRMQSLVEESNNKRRATADSSPAATA